MPGRRALLALALAAAACAGGPGAEPTAGTGTTGGAAGVSAALVRVVDGDTLLVSRGGVAEEVRLLGVNAPESDECFGAASREALATLLETGPLTLDGDGDRDQFDRLLAYARAGGVPINLALVEAGQALALQTDHPRLAEFLAAEERAFAAGAGLWAADACGPPSPAGIAVAAVEADPPGPDEEDLDGERVSIANDGPAVDLTGWSLRDESSQNRYRFPAGFLLEPGGTLTVHTGCGEDGRSDLYWCAPGPVWNNGGDTALLLDPAGNVAARLRYPG